MKTVFFMQDCFILVWNEGNNTRCAGATRSVFRWVWSCMSLAESHLKGAALEMRHAFNKHPVLWERANLIHSSFIFMWEPFGIFMSGFLRRRQTFLTALCGTISGSPGEIARWLRYAGKTGDDVLGRVARSNLAAAHSPLPITTPTVLNKSRWLEVFLLVPLAALALMCFWSNDWCGPWDHWACEKPWAQIRQVCSLFGAAITHTVQKQESPCCLRMSIFTFAEEVETHHNISSSK